MSEKKKKNKRTDIWIKFYIGDYLADTIGLSKAEHGSYMLTIFAYWRNKGPLTDQEFKRSTGSEFDAVSNFFDYDPERKIWSHKRIDAEIASNEEIRNKNKSNGKEGAVKRWQIDSETIATAIQEHSESIANAIQSDSETIAKDCFFDSESIAISESHSSEFKVQSLEIKNNKKRKNSFFCSFFETFWNSYPKKVAKPVAEKSWQKLKVDENLFSEILAGLEKWKRSEQWQKDNGQFVPNPATFLNQQRWRDQIEFTKPEKPKMELRKAYFLD